MRNTEVSLEAEINLRLEAVGVGEDDISGFQ